MKDVSVAELIVIIGLAVMPVVMGLALVVVAVCNKTGTSDVESWSTENDDLPDMEPGFKVNSISEPLKT